MEGVPSIVTESIPATPREGKAGLRLYLPATFDAAALPGLPIGWRHYAEWVVSAVVCGQLRDRLMPADPVPLANAFLRAGVSAVAVKDLPRRLVDAGVLATDWQFSRGTSEGPGRCRKFALGHAHRDAPLVSVPVTPHERPELHRKMTAARVAAEAEAVAADPPTMLAMLRHLKAVEVTGPPKGTDPAFAALAAGDPWFVRCDYGRLHTPATSLARRHRAHVRLAGEPLTAVDVCQSQPFLLTLALGCRRPGEGGEGGPGSRAEQRGSRAASSRSAGPPLCATYSGSGPNDDFAADVDAGELWGRLARSAGVPVAEVKPPAFAVLYGKAEHARTRVGLAWEREYPETFAAMLARKGEGDPAELARELQRRESAVMIGGAAARLVRERPEMPFLTVHDAVLCRGQDAEFVAGVIRSAWLERHGIAPRLKSEPWAESETPSTGASDA